MRNIYIRCEKCHGTGSVPVTVDGMPQDDEECSTCSGSGQVSVMGLHEDLINMLQDMNDKINDIFEKVNE